MRIFGFALLATGAAAAAIFGVGAMNTPPTAKAAATVSAEDVSLNDKNIPLDRALVVTELFTSQGCSSCPPADAVAARMAVDTSIIVLTRPVTYWDRLGWKDTLAREENTTLQRAYGRKNWAGDSVYTPQTVVNGAAHAVGSRASDIRTMIRSARRTATPNIASARDKDGNYMITIEGKAGARAKVSLIAVSSSETVNVGRGENGGRQLHYTNVVRSEVPIGTWNGGTGNYVVGRNALKVAGADKYVVVVRYPNAGKILGGRWL